MGLAPPISWKGIGTVTATSYRIILCDGTACINKGSRKLAAALREGQYELKPFLGQLFQAEIFYSARAFRTHIKSPVQLVIGTCRLLGVQANERALAVAMRG